MCYRYRRLIHTAASQFATYVFRWRNMPLAQHLKGFAAINKEANVEHGVAVKNNDLGFDRASMGELLQLSAWLSTSPLGEFASGLAEPLKHQKYEGMKAILRRCA